MDVNILGKNIKSALQDKKITQKELAVKIGVTETTMSKYINGSLKSPDINIIYAISDYLNVSLDWLCGRDEERKERDSEFDYFFLHKLSEDNVLLQIKIIGALLLTGGYGLDTNYGRYWIDIPEYVPGYILKELDKVIGLYKSGTLDIDLTGACISRLIQNYEYGNYNL